MAHEVNFRDVRRRIMEFGNRAALITVDGSNRPHVVSAVVDVGDDRLLARVGPRTRANLVEHPDVSLMWSPTAGGEYQLIIDGIAAPVDTSESAEQVSTVAISVTGGILHRLAELPSDGPSCIALASD